MNGPWFLSLVVGYNLVGGHPDDHPVDHPVDHLVDHPVDHDHRIYHRILAFFFLLK